VSMARTDVRAIGPYSQWVRIAIGGLRAQPGARAQDRVRRRARAGPRYRPMGPARLRTIAPVMIINGAPGMVCLKWPALTFILRSRASLHLSIKLCQQPRTACVCAGRQHEPAMSSLREPQLWLPPAQIHLTQGATPADMYISWATGNAVYTYCSQSDGAKCGDVKNACECNQTAPTMTSSQVKYGTDAGMETFEVAQDAGTYPVVVRS